VAINWYLASTFPGSLLPRDTKSAAKVQQWTSWAVTELEPPLVSIMREGRRAKEEVDTSRIEAARAEVHAMVDAVLEPALAREQYLLESVGFTLADLNVACVASVMEMFEIKLDRHPAVADWMRRCFGREAWTRAQQRP